MSNEELLEENQKLKERVAFLERTLNRGNTEKYKQKEAQKATIELLYITRAFRKGSVKNG